MVGFRNGYLTGWPYLIVGQSATVRLLQLTHNRNGNFIIGNSTKFTHGRRSDPPADNKVRTLKFKGSPNVFDLAKRSAY